MPGPPAAPIREHYECSEGSRVLRGGSGEGRRGLAGCMASQHCVMVVSFVQILDLKCGS